jgi:GT2 family glycosyltransferase
LRPEEDVVPDASLVVVCYEGEASIESCLESLLEDRTPRRELIVVDNASTDASLERIRDVAAAHPEIVVVASEQNLGYAGAVNLALPRCRGRVVVVLNMDLVAEPGWLGPLVDFLDAHSECGAVCPLLALSDGLRVNAAGQRIHVTGLGFNRGLGAERAAIGTQPFPVSGIQGAAFAIRRSLLEEMGGMDARGFLYHEDVALSWLLHMMGYSLYCVPESAMRHDYFLSMHAEKLFLLERNRLALILSHLRPLSLLAISPMLVLTEGMLFAYAALRGPRFLGAKLRSYLALARDGRGLGERRARAERLRRRPDRAVLRHLQWGYAWDQFAVLARERGAPRRPITGSARSEER